MTPYNSLCFRLASEGISGPPRQQGTFLPPEWPGFRGTTTASLYSSVAFDLMLLQPIIGEQELEAQPPLWEDVLGTPACTGRGCSLLGCCTHHAEAEGRDYACGLGSKVPALHAGLLGWSQADSFGEKEVEVEG